MRAFAPLLFLLAGVGPAASSAAAAPGSLDQSFGSQGVTSLATGTELFGVASQSDGRIVAVGSSGASLLVVRLSSQGGPEQTFAAGSGVGRGVAIQPDGRIVVAGYDSAGMLVERFNIDGSVDRSFGSNGVVHAVPGGQANAVALGPGGTIVAAGSVVAGDGFRRMVVIRLAPNGSLDSSLAGGGVAGLGGQDSVAHGVAVQSDGKVVVAGSQGPGVFQSVYGLLIRLTASGGVDPSFATGGVYSYFSQAGGAAASLNAVAIDSGGIVAAGGDGQNTPQGLFVRFSCAGGLVPGFGSGGVATLPAALNPMAGVFGAAGVVLAGGNQIVGTGRYQNNGVAEAALWGLGATGSETSFTTAPANSEGHAIALDSSGNLLVAGDALYTTGGVSNGFIARYVGFGPPPPGGSCGPSFSTAPPSVSTGAASGVTRTSATVSGSVNGNGLSPVYRFDYGTRVTYGSQSASQPSPSTGLANVSATLGGLSPGTLYHYRLTASNAIGRVYGQDQTFTSAAAPPPRAPPRLRLLGPTAFAVSSGLAGVLVGCSGRSPCQGAITLTAAGKVIGARTGAQIPGGTGAIVHVALTSAGARALALHGVLAIGVTVRDPDGAAVGANLTLVELASSAKVSRLRLLGWFSSASGHVEVLAGCAGRSRCIGRMTLSVGATTIAGTRYSIPANGTAIVEPSLNATGRTDLGRGHEGLRVQIGTRDRNGRFVGAHATLVKLSRAAQLALELAVVRAAR